MATPHPDTPPSDEVDGLLFDPAQSPHGVSANWDRFSAVPRATALFGVASRGPRRFASLTRTVNPGRAHTLDAIDQDGRAWWLVLGWHGPRGTWTELQPLPSYEEQP